MTTRKTMKKKKKNSNNIYKIYYWLTGIIIFISLIFFFRTTIIMYYYIIKEKFDKKEYVFNNLEKKRKKSEELKIQMTINRYRSYAFGIDISQHQGNINWDSLNLIKKDLPISFAFVRATRGIFYQDAFFNKNWKNLKQKNIIRGAYHYYDVNKSSTDQANNFINAVTLEKGDLPPVLDIEELPRKQSLTQLKKGILNWLEIVESKYKIKPIIYSNDAYFIHHIPDLDLSNYHIWVANYNPRDNPKHQQWSFWQFSEQGIIKGITQNFVDLNVFKGDINDLKKITLH